MWMRSRGWHFVVLVSACFIAVLLVALASASAASPQAKADIADSRQLGVQAGSNGRIPFDEQILDYAFGVESDGTIHVLWQGKLASYYDDYMFYSRSTDGGATFSPWQAIAFYGGQSPQVVVDDANHRVHLAYRDFDKGIVHRIVQNGVVSPPILIDGGAGGRLQLSLDATTGSVYATWQEFWLDQSSPYEWVGKYNAWYSRWDGTTWAPRSKIVNSNDVNYLGVAAGASSQVMMAWFQNWAETVGSGADAGGVSVLRTAYSTDTVKFGLRQEAGGYALPAKDDSLMLSYSRGDGKFYLLTDHFQYPGKSVAYRYRWDGAWSAGVNVSLNSSGFATPWFLGTANKSALNYYVWYGLQARSEVNGVLGPTQDLMQRFTSAGYDPYGAKFYIDSADVLHALITGSKDGQGGLYHYSLGPVQ